MTELATLVPPAVIVLVAALLVPFLPRLVGHALGTLSLVAVIVISWAAEPGAHYEVALFGVFDVVLFNVDDFSRALGIAFGVLGTAAVIYAYSSDTPRLTTAFALSYAASTFGLLFAGDWLTLLLFWELMAVTSTLLVWHYGGEAVRAGFRYAIAHGIGGSLLLFAVGWHFAEVGTFLFSDVEAITDGWPLYLAILGIGVNCGFIGLHTWLPDTYPRPHIAASVFLSVFTTKSSAYVMYRALPEGETAALAVAYMGGAMAVYGVVFALLQHDMRALLSYHIQAQVGYMVAAIGIALYVGGEAGIVGATGAMAHVFNNVLFKALLFMAVGVIIYRTGIHDLYKLGGLWREMPLTAVGFALGAFSITAIPGFNGFISKGMVLDAANPDYYGTGATEPIYWLLLVGAVGTFLSFIKLGYYAFLHGPYEGPAIEDAKPGQTAAMLSIGGLCLVFGLSWTALVGLLPFSAEAIELADPYSTAHLLDAVVLLTVSVLGFIAIKKPLSKIGHVNDLNAITNPLVFHGGRVGVLAVTESYRAIDRAGIRLVRACYWAGQHPAVFVDRTARSFPDWLVEVEERRPTDGGEPTSTIHLRAGIGRSALILTVVLIVFLLVLL